MYIGVSKSKIKRYADKMSHTFGLLILAASIIVFSGCNAKDKAGTESLPEETLSTEASYAWGMNIGSSMKADNFYPNMDEFIQGVKDTLYDSQPRYTLEEAYQIFSEEYQLLAEKRMMANMDAESKFLAENSKKPGIAVTDSGLQYEVIKEGSGHKPLEESIVKIHYEGSLVDGTVFDSSYPGGGPEELPLTGVMPGSGWAEALQLMNIGSKYRFFIPSDLGYGPQGVPPLIPPYATLIFEIELFDIYQRSRS
jgi:FKBP-type peptidyl-prolyl cis-trans isomerase